MSAGALSGRKGIHMSNLELLHPFKMVNPFQSPPEKLIREINKISNQIYEMRKTVVETLDAMEDLRDSMVEKVQEFIEIYCDDVA